MRPNDSQLLCGTVEWLMEMFDYSHCCTRGSRHILEGGFTDFSHYGHFMLDWSRERLVDEMIHELIVKSVKVDSFFIDEYPIGFSLSALMT